MNTADSGFEETSNMPAGRKARQVSDELWARLAESAKRKVAYSKTAAAEVIDGLRKDLSSAAVKAKYDVTTETTRLKDGVERLTFAAHHRTAAKTETAAKK